MLLLLWSVACWWHLPLPGRESEAPRPWHALQLQVPKHEVSAQNNVIPVPDTETLCGLDSCTLNPQE